MADEIADAQRAQKVEGQTGQPQPQSARTHRRVKHRPHAEQQEETIGGVEENAAEHKIQTVEAGHELIKADADQEQRHHRDQAGGDQHLPGKMRQRGAVGVQRLFQSRPEIQVRDPGLAGEGWQQQEDGQAEQETSGNLPQEPPPEGARMLQQPFEERLVENKDPFDPDQCHEKRRQKGRHRPVIRHGQAVNQRSRQQPAVFPAVMEFHETAYHKGEHQQIEHFTRRGDGVLPEA